MRFARREGKVETVARGRRALGWLFHFLLALAFCESSPAHASELSGSELEVSRKPEAADCPDTALLTRSVGALGTAPSQPSEPMRVEVSFEHNQDGYTATIRSFGRKPGLRRLATTGKTCEPLADAVAVALAVLLDLIPPPENKVETRATDAAPPIDERAPFVLAVGVRAGVGYGELGNGVSGVFSALVRLSRERFQLLGSAFWSTPRDSDFGPGSVELGLWGGGLDACFRLGASSRERLGWSPCAGFRLGSLSGRGVQFDRNYEASQTWTALVAGGSLHVPLRRNWGFVAALSAVVPLKQHRFLVAGAGAAFENRPLGLLLEVGPETAIW